MTMKKQKKETCPTCAGKKRVAGTCTCSLEWQGNQQGDELEQCQCSTEVTCPTCHGNGYVKSPQ
jgi:hypothetical protein